MKKISSTWHREQILKYKAVQPAYIAYADTLHKILERAATVFAPEAIIQSRAKSLSSFAEKAARKAYKYEDPVNQITDLCGARIIAHLPSQVDSLRTFIRDSFKIDEANSLDVSTRLRTAEFGYLSIHFIVIPEADEILGVPIPGEIRDKKAEIQLRTLLQHTWAAISHDRIYKSPIKVPQESMRESARLAALMENADHAFERLAATLDSYAADYGLLMSPEDLAGEVEILKILLQNDPDRTSKPLNALRLSRLYKATGDWRKIIALLSEFKDTDGPLKSLIQIELGNAFCLHHKRNPGSAGYRLGQSLLQKVIERHTEVKRAGEASPAYLPKGDERKIAAQALALLASTYREIKNQVKLTRDLYDRAYKLDHENPYILASFLEYEIGYRHDDTFITGLHPAIMAAIEKCRANVRACIGLPWAYLTMGKLWLFLEEPFRSLNAYAKAIDLCISRKVAVPEDCFDNEIVSLKRMAAGKEFPESFESVTMLLQLAKAVMCAQRGGGDIELQRYALRDKPFKAPALIVAGGADGMSAGELKRYRSYFKIAFTRPSGSIISGGTASGIPGLVGSVLGPLRKAEEREFDLTGYLPSLLPVNEKADHRNYDALITTHGEKHSPLEPLHYWADLIASGVEPRNVRLLGINGGRIAAFEYRLALALGAMIGVIESSGRAASELARDEDWVDNERLLVLPEDPMTVWAFANSAIQSRLTDNQIERAARKVHERFSEMKKKKIADPSLLEWEDLRDDFKNSNRQQVRYMEEILRRAGYGIRKVSEKKAVHVEMSGTDVTKMAEMEHGRWIAERLASGWRYGPKKDVEKKISPYLVAWRDLPEKVKDYDRTAVRNFAEVLESAGFEIYALRAHDR